MSSLSSDLFANTLSAYNTARRWFYWGLLLLVLIQSLFIAPYHKLVAAQQTSSDDIAKHEERQLALDQLQARLAEYEKAVVSARHALVSVPTQELVERFDKLNAIVLELHQMGPDAASGDRGMLTVGEIPPGLNLESNLDDVQRLRFSAGSAPRTGGPQAQAAPQVSNASISEEPESRWWDGYQTMSRETRRAVAESATQSELLKALEDYVDTTIVDPIYGRMAMQWEKNLFPAIEASSEGVLTALQIEPWRKEIEEKLNAISNSLDKSLAEIRAIEIKPPESPFWWSQRHMKSMELEKASDGLITSEETIKQQLTSATSIEAEVKKMMTDSKNVYDAYVKEKADLEKRFEDMQLELTEASTPLPSLALDLETTAPWFPLWLGLALSLLTIFPAIQLQKLSKLLPLLNDQGDHNAARLWLMTEIGDPAQRVMALIAMKAVVFVVWIYFFAAAPSEEEQSLLIGGIIEFHVLGAALVIVAAFIEAGLLLSARRRVFDAVET